jgi:hypothetical protein
MRKFCGPLIFWAFIYILSEKVFSAGINLEKNSKVSDAPTLTFLPKLAAEKFY